MNAPALTKAQEKDAADFLQWRLDMGLTQQEAADTLAFKNRSSICNLEKGVAHITPRLKLLCQMLLKEYGEPVESRKIILRKSLATNSSGC